MIDLSNKCIVTENDNESEQLLRCAVQQGYSLPKGLKALAVKRIFDFTGFPYKAVSCPNQMTSSAVRYSELFGDENKELEEIVLKATRFCRAHGYSILRVYADEVENSFFGSAIAKTLDGGMLKTDCTVPKLRKVTLEEIEQRFGCPIEIVS